MTIQITKPCVGYDPKEFVSYFEAPQEFPVSQGEAEYVGVVMGGWVCINTPEGKPVVVSPNVVKYP